MNKKILRASLVLLSFIISSCGTSDGTSSKEIEHTHTFKNEWSMNETQHWHDASCGHDVVSERANHVFGDLIVDTNPTCTTDGSGHYICEVCQYEKTVSIDKHPHQFASAWTYNDEYHWHKCETCSEISEKASHSFGNWENDREPTETTQGLKHRDCTICDYRQEEIIPIVQLIEATDMVINPSSATIKTGDTLQLEAVFTPTNATNTVTWGMSNYYSYYATLSDTGLVTAYNPGNIQVWAQFSSPSLGIFNQTAYCDITIEQGTTIDPGNENGTVDYQNLYFNYETRTYSVVGLNTPVEEIIVPSTYKGYPVTEIYSFGQMTPDNVVNLKKVTIPNSVTRIADTGFINCHLDEVKYTGSRADFLSILRCPCPFNTICSDGILSDNVTGPELENDYSSQVEVGNFVYRYFGNTVRATLKNNVLTAHVPATYNGVPVTFGGRYNEEEIANVKDLTINAFQTDASGLYGFDKLENITFGWNAMRLHNSTCYNMYDENLEDFYFYIDSSEVVSQVDTNLENKEPNLSIEIDELNQFYSSSNNIVYSNNKEYLLFAGTGIEGDVVVDAKVKHINYGSFMRCGKINSVTLPAAVTAISNSAFYESSVKEINALGVQVIGDNAFSYCKKLDTLNTATLTSIGKGSFFDCESLKSFVVPEEMTILPERCFSGCKSLESITLPSHLVEIEAFALATGMWKDSSALEHIDLPNTLKFIGVGAFYGCALKEVSLPDSVVVIAEEAFALCNNLETLNISQNVEIIGDGVVYGCLSLNEISVDESNPYYKTVSGVLYNKTMTRLIAFPTGKATTYFAIPDTVRVISYHAFFKDENDSTFKGVVIPKTLTYILQKGFVDENDGMTFYLFYCGSYDEWQQVHLDPMGSFDEVWPNIIEVVFYSENVPTDGDYTYWHYVEGIPTLW